MHHKNKIILFEIISAFLGFSAIVTEIAVIVERGKFNSVNFFSYFTIESNIFAVVMLVIGALALSQGTKSKAIDMARGAATMYMIITGIVFALLLSGVENVSLTAVPWDNTVLHYIMPLVLLIDWLIDKPKLPLRFKQSFVWLLFPILYLLYSLIRGNIVHWYPYPFLNPSTNGYGGIVLTSAGILGLGLALIWALNKTSRQKDPV
jgi:hypothetical protein